MAGNDTITSSKNHIILISSSHLLQELTVSSYVPNDFAIMGGTSDSDSSRDSSQAKQLPSMLLLTGPNFSGKSVYMKQVALIIYLAQIGRFVLSSLFGLKTLLMLGSFVPADSAELGITDKILTKINTQESVSKVLHWPSCIDNTDYITDTKHFYERLTANLSLPSTGFK